ncbi:two-component system sensor histidine kinase YesM [Anaerobacterium chartisolvens]|uniref:Two-component system sensor histidine kinase YesM n=2 Tax=Anaerobacterium chartisolvens TaxID=1297424 RepID=A0A369AQM7_9FIRM|nr:two-component system sensor histidine kinase YesM [Anaerobacterium chartisolvens]
MRKLNYYINRIFRKSISGKFVISMTTLVVLSVFLVGYGSFQVAGDVVERETRNYVEDILLQTGKNIEMSLKNISDIVFYLQINSVLQTSITHAKDNEEGLKEIQTRENIQNTIYHSVLYNDEIEAVELISDSGKVFEINKTLEEHFLNRTGKKEIYEAKGSKLWVATDPETRTFAISAAVNSLRTQKPLGYINFYVKESYINNIFSQMEFLNSGEMFIMNRDGIIISHNDKSLLNTKIKQEYTKEIFNGNNRGFFSRKINNEESYVAYLYLEEQSWYIVSIIPAIKYSQTLLLVRFAIIIIGLCVVIIAIFAAIFITNRISRPIKKLKVAMKQFGEGDMSVNCSVESQDEIGQLSRDFNKMVQNINELIRRVYDETLLKQQAELKSLRMQINPHFFYNTLETINWMARINGVTEIGVVAKAMGELMRLTIGGSDFIKICDELKSVSNYISIQKYRYDDKLSVSMDIDEELYELYIPKLILQPIIENSIVHGILNKASGGHIEIRGSLISDIVEFTVSDDGAGIHPDRMKEILENNFATLEDEHTHVGVNNVDRRLKIYYGEKYGVQIESKLGIGTKVTIRFPGLKFSPDDNTR